MIAGRYEVGEMIGRGGMAEVFAGTDRRLGRQVAIKLVLPTMAARPDARARFEAEARAAASLSHPNAVAVFDTGEHDGVPYIVMERLGGETLGDRIAAGPVDPAWLTPVATEVLGALGAAHALGLIHRDIKPGNILLTADGTAKVADFGIAKSLEEVDGADLTATGQLLGTPAYLAPERLDGVAASPRSDLWALGVVLYEALAGSKPFIGTTALATARAVMAGTHRSLAEIRPDLDPRLVAAIERAMATDPAARFSSADEMAAALKSPTGAATLASTLADTVNVAGAGPGGDGTQVLDRDGIDDRVAAAPQDPPVRRDWLQRGLIGVVLVGLGLLVVFLVLRPGSSSRQPSPLTAGATSSTAPRATSTVAATAGLAQQLRDAAGRLGPDDGSMAATLASRLQALAGQVQAGGGGSDATALVATTVGLARAGQLTPGAAATVVQVLARVPGIDQSVLDALTATVAPTTAAPSPTAPGSGKGRKDKD